MSVIISKQYVRDFYDARMSRDPGIIAPFLADDVEWSITGPIDLIPFCGQWHGKAAAIDVMCRVAPSCITVRNFTIDELLVDDNRAELTDAAIGAIRKQLEGILVKMEAGRIAAGGARALRLFG